MKTYFRRLLPMLVFGVGVVLGLSGCVTGELNQRTNADHWDVVEKVYLGHDGSLTIRMHSSSRTNTKTLLVQIPRERLQSATADSKRVVVAFSPWRHGENQFAADTETASEEAFIPASAKPGVWVEAIKTKYGNYTVDFAGAEGISTQQYGLVLLDHSRKTPGGWVTFGVLAPGAVAADTVYVAAVGVVVVVTSPIWVPWWISYKRSGARCPI